MPEIRLNLATDEWVIIATERAKRPEDFRKKEHEKLEERPTYKDSCPFCPGNEDQTSGEIYRVEDASGKWRIRIVPNRYPALSPEGLPKRRIQGIRRVIEGVGLHEVIVESPVHNSILALMSVDQVEEIVRAYLSRYREIEKDRRISHIVIFKNHGESAGTSLEHPHSQIVATPVVPTGVRHRMEEARRYFDGNGTCVYCDMMNEEIREKERIVVEDEHFVAFIPFAALSPFHIWILPKRHATTFGEIGEPELKKLARVLKTVTAKLYYGLDNPDFNYMIRTAPLDQRGVEYFHWYMAFVPRVSKMAGFELGSGMFINTALPEVSAEFLRNVETPV